MSPTADAFLRSWPLAPWLYVALFVPAAIYFRGWWSLHRRAPRTWHAGRLAAFLGGLGAIFLALGSPVEPFGSLLLQVHMVQHLLFMMVAPPLVWLGAPLLPMVRGLPRPVRVYWVAPVLRSPTVRRVFGWLSSPVPALSLYLLTTWVWHIPGIYETALRSSAIHRLQHGSFLAASLLFWYPVVRPHPFRPRWSAWLLLPYLLIADLSNTVLSALLTFSDRVLYPYYGQIPRVAGIAALDDQSAAGVIMWVPGSLAFLVPLFAIGTRLLFGTPHHSRRAPRAVRSITAHGACLLRDPVPSTTTPGFDALRLPILGAFLRWRHARLSIQLVTSALAAIVIADGLFGTQVAAMNLAGVLPWIHWRGLVILGLLVAGNVSCMACPFLVPRTVARRWLPSRLRWPPVLRNKWLSAALLVLFLWSYEAFSLWDSPWWTAWIVVGYFVAAFAVDGLFKGASFCKYVCPIGQFNFVQSLVSPMEVTVRAPSTCQACRTRECLRGSAAGLPGCELGLFLPRKSGNLDCTFCLDCVRACPHDNIGIVPVMPGRDLWNDAPHSGIGRLKDRPDLAALILVLVFGAFANAAGMTAPVLAWQDALARRLGSIPFLAITSAYYLAALIAVPLVTVALATSLCARSMGDGADRLETATRFSFALVPIGFGMWLSHYSYHFVTSYQAAIPAVEQFALRIGWPGAGSPSWSLACCRPAAGWLPRFEIVCLDLGLLLSLYSAYRIARNQSIRPGRAIVPWAFVIVTLFAAGVWIVQQPMQMRGTMTGLGG